jgi:hypothetical protein
MGLFDFFRKKTPPVPPSAPDPPAPPAIARATFGTVHFEGGGGETVETAVVIRGAPSQSVGVKAEFDYLAQRFGRAGTDWTLVKQSLVEPEGRPYDAMCIRLADGSLKMVFFDIAHVPDAAR